ncbi:MAG: 50S ribosomal protein L29 [Phycisphaeraceae bacterium]|nr:MAG: 50S ribosomal protein L29 [Phycisphaeraceae bacterium]
MKAAEVHRMKDEEITIEIDRLQRKLFDLRCAVVTEKIEDPSLFGKVRRDIARLKTERRARQIKKTAKA